MGELFIFPSMLSHCLFFLLVLNNGKRVWLFLEQILFAAFSFRTEIQWHPGKCLTQKILKKKPKKGSKNAKPITKTETCESFFNFFNPPEVPEDDEDIDEDMVSMTFLINTIKIKIRYLFCYTVAVDRTTFMLKLILFLNRLRSFRIRWNKTMTLGELNCLFLVLVVTCLLNFFSR